MSPAQDPGLTELERPAADPVEDEDTEAAEEEQTEPEEPIVDEPQDTDEQPGGRATPGGLAVGRTVHYVVQLGAETKPRHLAAIVTRVHPDGTTIDLNAHYPADQTRYPPVVSFGAVKQSGNFHQGTWHWPERVGGP